MTTLARPAFPPSATLRDLIALTKPRITLMVVLTTAGGLWLAPGAMSAFGVLGTLLATALTVAAANTLNCWMERDIDRHMARTKRRPLPAGRLSANAALGLGLGLGAVGVPMLTSVANPLTGLLGAVALLSYVGVYTPMKRVHPVALAIGAVPGAMPPLMGWTAATGELSAPGLVLFGILFVWQMPHFMAIAIFRQREYAKAGIKVLPSERGNPAAKWHALWWSVLLVPVSLALVPVGVAGPLYAASATALGLAFLALTVRGRWATAENRWARQLFLGSLIYLPLLLVALGVDVALAA